MLKDVYTGDGRRLAVEISGDPGGSPVFLLHGTPGSRLGPAPRPMLLYHQRVRLITYDRPGYGPSDRLPGRQVAHVSGDVAAIADALGVERFAVVGRSGGGPHALACAALLPDRVTRAAVLVSLAPRDADGLDWFAGMTASNVPRRVQRHEHPAAGQRVAELTAPDLPDAHRSVHESRRARMRRHVPDVFAELFEEAVDPQIRVGRSGSVLWHSGVTEKEIGGGGVPPWFRRLHAIPRSRPPHPLARPRGGGHSVQEPRSDL
ncbi:pimeloyl-ACP methyl ester carboxylesterase [Streptomyces sp. V4I8]|uniref:alpha/beta fold hydrolase n=1 Tax=Streptomyces sp. V4I8 TaxID=3156469 RepID=UPI0035147D86